MLNPGIIVLALLFSALVGVVFGYSLCTRPRSSSIRSTHYAASSARPGRGRPFHIAPFHIVWHL
jgi:hypothetical protein